MPIGVWQTQGYGSIFEVEQGRITLFDTLGSDCLRHLEMKPATFSGIYGDWVRASLSTDPSWHLSISGMTVTQLDHLPRACADAPQAPDSDPLRNFDYLWNTFNTHYAFFAAHGVDWNAVREKYRSQVAALPKDGDPFPIFAEMLTLLKDTHVRLSDGKRVAHVRRYPDVTETRPNGTVLLDDHYLQSHLVDYLKGPDTPLAAPAKGTADGEVWYGLLKYGDSTNKMSPKNARFGYVALFSMDRFGEGENDDMPLDTRVQSVEIAMNEVITAFHGVKGIVIDLRYNGGGEDSVALAIAGRFTNVPLPVWSKRAYENGRTHPVFNMEVKPSTGDKLPVPLAVLTSDFTVSAAETATMALRALPSTIQIGQPTRGVLSDKLEKILPNGWIFSLSNEIYSDPRGEIFEVRGVPPSVVTTSPSPRADDSERFDRDISLAIQKLNSMQASQTIH